MGFSSLVIQKGYTLLLMAWTGDNPSSHQSRLVDLTIMLQKYELTMTSSFVPQEVPNAKYV